MTGQDRLFNLILRAPASLKSRVRIVWLRILGAKIGQRCRLEKVQISRNPWDIQLSEGVALDHGVILLSTGERIHQPRIFIGARTYINRGTMIDASLSVQIGSDVMIGPGCYITDHDHDAKEGEVIGKQPLIEAETRIGDNVWIGANVTILKGVHVGAGAIIGAGSVVTKSVVPGARVAGVPARPIQRT